MGYLSTDVHHFEVTKDMTVMIRYSDVVTTA